MEEKAFNKEFDFGFVGDGEESWIKFLQAKEQKIGLHEVPGLMYRENGIIKKIISFQHIITTFLVEKLSKLMK